jgi:two-component system phosphate regulon sensor histidine kinase PhoR
MNTLRSKITLTFFLLSVSVIFLLGILSSYEIERYTFHRIVVDLTAETDALGKLIEESATMEESPDHLWRTLSAIAEARRLRITLIDSEGVVRYDSSFPDSLLHTLDNHLTRPEVVEAQGRGTGTNVRRSASIQLDLLYVARLLRSDVLKGSTAGLRFVRIAHELVDVDAMMYEIRFKIVVAGVIVLILVLGASRLVARRISRPLTEIAEMVKEIKGGNLNQKLPVRSQDEIGKLSELVNELTATLKADLEQLHTLERVRSQFLANVSHELRTPIFSLKGFLETLLDGAVNDPAVNKKFVEKAYHHANRLDSLLNDLIEISRIESGEMKLSFRYFDGGQLIRQVVADCSDNATSKEQKIVVEGPVEATMVYGDKDRLRLAVGNIIDNAIKYSPQGATITVSLISHRDGVTISVSDNGPGIETEHLPRIFERFYRVDKARSRDVGGTGLGLAIVKHIVEAHGSKVGVQSDLGRGTTFSFELRT